MRNFIFCILCLTMLRCESNIETVSWQNTSNQTRQAVLTTDSQGEPRIVTIGAQNEISLWDLHGNLQKTLHSGAYKASFLPDGEQILIEQSNGLRSILVPPEFQNRPLARGSSGDVVAIATTESFQNIALYTLKNKILLGPDQDPQSIMQSIDLQSPVGELGYPHYATFSGDGTHLLTIHNDGIPRIWDATTGAFLRTLVGHTEAIVSAAFSADAKSIVTTSSDNTARVWNVTKLPVSAAWEAVILRGHRDKVRSAQFSPDGVRVVTCGDDQTIRLWERATGNLLLTLYGHKNVVQMTSFSLDGNQFVSAAWDDTVRLWDVANTKVRPQLLGTQTTGTKSLSGTFSADGAWLALTASDNSVQIWKQNDSGWNRAQYLEGNTWKYVTLPHNKAILKTMFSATNDRLFVWASDQLWVWDLALAKLVVTTTPSVATFNQNFGVAMGTSKPLFLLGTTLADGSIQKLNLIELSGTSLVNKNTLDLSLIPTTTALLSPQGDQLLTTTRDFKVQVSTWDGNTNKWLAPVSLLGHNDRILMAAFSGDGKAIVSASADHSARLWKNQGNGYEFSSLLRQSSAISFVAFSENSERIFTFSNEACEGNLWNATTGNFQNSFSFLPSTATPTTGCSASPTASGAEVFAQQNTGMLGIWLPLPSTKFDLLQSITASTDSSKISPKGNQFLSIQEGQAALWPIYIGTEQMQMSLLKSNLSMEGEVPSHP